MTTPPQAQVDGDLEVVLRELGDAIRAMKTFVVFHPNLVWSINMLGRWQTDWAEIYRRLHPNDPPKQWED